MKKSKSKESGACFLKYLKAKVPKNLVRSGEKFDMRRPDDAKEKVLILDFRFELILVQHYTFHDPY